MSEEHAQLTARDIHGPYTQLLTNLQGDNGPVWLDSLNRFLRKEDPWGEPKRLRYLRSRAVLGYNRFVVSEHFHKINFEKHVRFLSKDFGHNFLRMVELTTDDDCIKSHRLLRNSSDLSIIAELGDKSTLKLNQLFRLVVLQKNGEEGFLDVAGGVNTCYIRNHDRELLAVSLFWGSNQGRSGWAFETHHIGRLAKVYEGCTVLSR